MCKVCQKVYIAKIFGDWKGWVKLDVFHKLKVTHRSAVIVNNDYDGSQNICIP